MEQLDVLATVFCVNEYATLSEYFGSLSIASVMQIIEDTICTDYTNNDFKALITLAVSLTTKSPNLGDALLMANFLKRLHKTKVIKVTSDMLAPDLCAFLSFPSIKKILIGDCTPEWQIAAFVAAREKGLSRKLFVARGATAIGDFTLTTEEVQIHRYFCPPDLPLDDTSKPFLMSVLKKYQSLNPPANSAEAVAGADMVVVTTPPVSTGWLW